MSISAQLRYKPVGKWARVIFDSTFRKKIPEMELRVCKLSDLARISFLFFIGFIRIYSLYGGLHYKRTS
jgi:hypothetical protein